jgi:hypothetical protein
LDFHYGFQLFLLHLTRIDSVDGYSRLVANHHARFSPLMFVHITDTVAIEHCGRVGARAL